MLKGTSAGMGQHPSMRQAPERDIQIRNKRWRGTNADEIPRVLKWKFATWEERRSHKALSSAFTPRSCFRTSSHQRASERVHCLHRREEVERAARRLRVGGDRITRPTVHAVHPAHALIQGCGCLAELHAADVRVFRQGAQ